MLDRETLLAKKASYLDVIAGLESKDFTAEVEPKVEEYRRQLLKEAYAERDKDVNKLKTYVELIDDLVNEAEAEEEQTLQFNSESNETQEESVTEQP